MQIRTIKLIFLIAGVYDIILGIGSLFLTESLSNFFNTPIPYPLLYPQVIGLFLLALGYMLIFAAKDIKKFAFIGFASLFVRYSFVLIILLTSMSQTVDFIYFVIAFTDFLTGTLLLISLLSKEIEIKEFLIIR